MRKRSYITWALVPAAVALVIAPTAAADPGQPWCGYGQNPSRDYCRSVPPLPATAQPDDGRHATQQQMVQCPTGTVEVSEGICAPPP